MNSKTIVFLLSTTLATFLQSLFAQSIEELTSAYSGNVSWNSKLKQLTFESSGTIHFDKPNYKEHFWDIPTEVKEVFIEKSVTVTGAFHTFADCRIHGADRKTSIVYGTFEREWANNRPIQEWYYCQFQNFGGSLTIENLTCLNPFSYFIRGWDSPNFVRSCDFIDYRGGEHNHSDGFSGGDGSIVEDCFFEAGDDVFKAYFDNTIRDCTIRMVKNSVPIQMGWGNYSDGADCTFENLVIVGDGGRRSSGNAIICGRNGEFQVGVSINECTIENPFASLISLWQDSMELTGNITNAKVQVGQYWDKTAGKSTLTIDGLGVEDACFQTGKAPKIHYDDPVAKEIATQKDYFNDQIARWKEQYPETVANYPSIFQNAVEVSCLTSRIINSLSAGNEREKDLWFSTTENLISDHTAKDYPWMSIPAYVTALLEKKRMQKQTPIDLIRSIDVRSDAILDSIAAIEKQEHASISNSVWQTHLRASAYLGKYWTNKLESAVFLQMTKTFPVHKEQHQQRSLKYLKDAEKNWNYFEQTTKGSFSNSADIPYTSSGKTKIRELVRNEINGRQQQ